MSYQSDFILKNDLKMHGMYSQLIMRNLNDLKRPVERQGWDFECVSRICNLTVQSSKDIDDML